MIKNKNSRRSATAKQFNTDIDMRLFEQIDAALKEKGWSKAEFIRQAAKELLGIDIDTVLAKESEKLSK